MLNISHFIVTTSSIIAFLSLTCEQTHQNEECVRVSCCGKPCLMMQGKIKSTALFVFILFFIFFLVIPVGAATRTWIGAGDASNDANWSGGQKPIADDDVVFNGTSPGDCTWDIAGIIKVNSFTMDQGYTGTVSLSQNLYVGTGDISIAGGILEAHSRTVELEGDWNFFAGLNTPLGDVDEDGSIGMTDVADMVWMVMELNPKHSCSDVNANGTVDISDIVLAMRAVYGMDASQPCTGGSFIPGSSNVVLSGTEQTIYGNNTFNDLTKTGSSADTLYFEAGSVQTILGGLTLNGSSSAMLALKSTVDEYPWFLDARGNRNISYTSIKDLSNVNFVDIVTTHSDDSGNNQGVSFGGDLCVCRKEKFILARLLCEEGRPSC